MADLCSACWWRSNGFEDCEVVDVVGVKEVEEWLAPFERA